MAFSQIYRSPGYTNYPPVAESTSVDLNGEQASSQQAQNQFHIPGGPINAPFPPTGHFHFLPSQPYMAPLNYGEGFENDPNISKSQLEAHKKILQQIEVQLHLFFFFHCVISLFDKKVELHILSGDEIDYSNSR